MNLIISFSGRKDGNCDRIAKFIFKKTDKIIFFRDLNVHCCSHCDYECFGTGCKYRDDGIYDIYESMISFEKIILIVPMYCGNPSSLYFIFNERSQDFFLCHGEQYETIISRLYIIGIYGDREKTPDFIPCFEKWFACSSYTDRVLGIERHPYDQKLHDSILNIDEVKNKITNFIFETKEIGNIMNKRHKAGLCECK